MTGLKRLYSAAAGAALAATMVVGQPAIAADLPQALPEDTGPVFSPDFYATVFGGVNFLDDANFSGIIAGAPQSVDVDYDDGFVVGGALGVRWNSFNFGPLVPRTEIEVSYRENDVDSVDFSGNGPGNEPNASGDTSALFVMGNLLFDIKGLFDDRFTPYFGGGVGVAFVENDVVYGPGITLDDDDEAFAFQVIVGADYKFTERFSVFVDGRYFQALDVSSSRVTPAGVNTGTVEEDLEGFNALGGIRYTF
ncbi:MAG: outer membrane protein [Aestuariivirgaceae bacterium]